MLARQAEECGGGVTALWCGMLCASLGLVPVEEENPSSLLSPFWVQKTQL